MPGARAYEHFLGDINASASVRDSHPGSGPRDPNDFTISFPNRPGSYSAAEEELV